MRRVNQDWTGPAVLVSARNAWRRVDWFASGLTARQLANGAVAAVSYGLRRQTLRSWPVLVKIDISPMCNLHCTYCVHAATSVDRDGALREQRFSNGQRMPADRYQALIDEIAGRTAAVALYYVGDPLTHPQLAKFCTVASEAGLNCHVSTNFSFHLSDARIEGLVKSGLSHLTVCVDSMIQERYERTRVGGDVGLVLRNLERILQIRSHLGATRPKVEVQFIKYQHNADEVEGAAAWCAARGVDQFTEYWGNLHNYVDLDPSKLETTGALDGGALPRCAWPWFAMQVKHDGDVLPCCYHRVSEQYRVGGDSRPVGNVVAHGLRAVWNSAEYRRIRRLSANPAAAARREDVSASFCHGCPTVFHSSSSGRVITADTTRWEDVYFRSQSGTVTRR